MGPHRFNSKFFALDLTADFMTRTGRQLSPRLPEWSELFGKVNPGGAGLFIGGLGCGGVLVILKIRVSEISTKSGKS